MKDSENICQRIHKDVACTMRRHRYLKNRGLIQSRDHRGHRLACAVHVSVYFLLSWERRLILCRHEWRAGLSIFIVKTWGLAFRLSSIIPLERLKELPTAPDHYNSKENPELHMIVDSTSQSFKLFPIKHNNDDSEFLADPGSSQEDRSMLLNDPLVRVYGSTTNEWKSWTNPSCIQKYGVNDVCCILFQGHLHFLLGSHYGQHPLWRYNPSEDTWENLAVHMPCRIILPQFMISGNRLYLAAWLLEQVVIQFNIGMSRRCRFEVSEINITDFTQKTLSRMSNAEVMEAFDIKTEQIEVIASGFGQQSLLFIAISSTKPMVFDLGTRLGLISDEDYFELAGKLMNLILPNTPV